MTISSVVFDIGNVFVEWDPRRLYEQLIADKDELDAFLRDVVNLDWHSEHDRGRPFKEGVRFLTRQFPQHEKLIQLFDTRWAETIGPAFPETVQCLKQLIDASVPCFALTNFSAEKWPEFYRDYEFPKLFKGVVVSGEEKLIKPDPAIFELTINRFNLNPTETLFIDDRLDNVQAAESCGMVGYHFTQPAALRPHLVTLGLI